jgi:predicted HTH domain antitoxin
MIQFQLPASLEESLRQNLGRDLALEARDALLAEAYRRAKISVRELASVLGVSIDGAHGFLKARGVPLNYSLDDLDQDLATFERVYRRTS